MAAAMDRMHSPIRTAALAAIALLLAAHAASAAGSASPDDTARILAGMQPSAESPLALLTREGGWQSHAKSFDSAWKRLDERQLSRIRAWSGKEHADPRSVVFYMFSGPDYLYADAFFPKASTYVLSGLEPVGQVPDLTALPRGSIGRELREIEASLSSVLSYSFFITEKMKRQLGSGRVTGTLPILYVFLARSGKTISEVSLVSLDPDGAVQPAGTTVSKSASRGVKIIFSGPEGGTQTLYYFSTDLSDSGVKSSGFLKFCEGLGSGDSLLKSASYLLHSDNFSKVRDFLLHHSAAIVQDDSGIPARYFAPKEWELHPFGNYLGPISIFPGRYQPKLREVFRNGRTVRLDFGIGYRWRPYESNLLLAVKSGAKSAQDQ